jgi:hypothetical protein
MTRKTEWAIAALLLAAGAAPFWAGRFLPFQDLPQHLALANVLARWSDPATSFSRFYALEIRASPYWGYHAPMWFLTRLLPLEIANKVLLSAWAVAIPVSAGFAMRALGRDGRWAVLSMPLVWTSNLFFGFAPFLLSMPLFFWALGLAARHLPGDRPGGRRAWLLAVASAAVFLAHVQTYLLLGLCVLTLLAVEWRGARWTLPRAAPFLPSLALFAAWALPNFVFNTNPAMPLPHTAAYRNFGTFRHMGAVFEPPAQVLARMPDRIWGMYGDSSGSWIGVSWLLLFGLSVALASWPDPGMASPPVPTDKLRHALRARRGEVLAVLALACGLLLPIEVAGQWYLSARYLTFAVMLAPCFIAASATGWRVTLLGAAAGLALVSDGVAFRKVADFQGQVRGFAGLVDRMEPGGRALGLIFDRGEGGPVNRPVLMHFAAYYPALRGGDVGFSFAGLPAIPVRYRPGSQAPHPSEWRPQDFRWETMGQHYDYFLVNGTARGDAERLGEHTDLVAEEGGWRLWARRGGPVGKE